MQYGIYNLDHEKLATVDNLDAAYEWCEQITPKPFIKSVIVEHDGKATAGYDVGVHWRENLCVYVRPLGYFNETPDGEPNGPYTTEEEALDDAQDDAQD